MIYKYEIQEAEGLSSYNSLEEFEAHKAKLVESGISFVEIDNTIKVAEREDKKDKKAAAKNKFKNFDKSKLTTIAACREVLADIVDMLDDGE